MNASIDYKYESHVHRNRDSVYYLDSGISLSLPAMNGIPATYTCRGCGEPQAQALFELMMFQLVDTHSFSLPQTSSLFHSCLSVSRRSKYIPNRRDRSLFCHSRKQSIFQSVSRLNQCASLFPPSAAHCASNISCSIGKCKEDN